MAAVAAPSPDYRPLKALALTSVVGLHLLAVGLAMAWVQQPETPSVPAVLAVSFLAPAEQPPTPLPATPVPPPPVVTPAPKPRPLISAARAEPVADAIQTPPPPPTADAEPAPEPVTAYRSIPADDASASEPEPPRFDMAYLSNPQPTFPAMSRKLREEGTVLLRVRVSADGEALSVDVAQSSGFARLDDAARRAVQKWKFVPSRRGDTPVEGVAMVPLVFALKKSA